jgi:hypothetical protein
MSLRIESTRPPRSCHVRPQPLPNMEAMSFPHSASLAYFQPFSTPRTTPILRSEPPTPRKMLSTAPACSPMMPRCRRYSGIPRPSSGSSRRATSSTQQLLMSGEVSSIITVPPSPCNADQARLRPSDPLQSWSDDAPRDQDLSGVRHQLHIRNFSTKSVQGLEVFSSPCDTAVRSLMRPLGPPLPRSHTMGSLAFDNLPSPAMRKVGRGDYRSRRVLSASPKIDVVDALHESRMTQEEVVLFNRIEKEKELNKLRLSGVGAARKLPNPIHPLREDRDGDTMSSSWLSSPRFATKTIFQGQSKRTTASGNGMLRIDLSLASTSRVSSLLTPKSALSTCTSPEKVDPRHVSNTFLAPRAFRITDDLAGVYRRASRVLDWKIRCSL